MHYMRSSTLATSSKNVRHQHHTNPTIHQHHFDLVKEVSNHEISKRGSTKGAHQTDVSTFEKKKQIFFIFKVEKFELEQLLYILNFFVTCRF